MNRTETIPAPTPSAVGAVLREWRERRRLSQLDLALDAALVYRGPPQSEADLASTAPALA